MSDTMPLSQWMQAVEEGARSIATEAMGQESFEVVSRDDRIPEGMPGAFIPLVAAHEAVQIGLVSSNAGCLALARHLLQAPADEHLTRVDMADALGEATNILAGFVKRNLQDTAGTLQLGLPLYVHGHLETGDRMEVAVTHVRIGPIEASLIVMKAAQWQPRAAAV